MADIFLTFTSAVADRDTVAAEAQRSSSFAVEQGPGPVVPQQLSFRAVNRPGSSGYDPGLQRHHLLPRQLLSKRCFGAFFERMRSQRLSFDDFCSNGLLLPASERSALRSGLPLHRGPHREYNALVIERVGQLEARWSRRRLRHPQAAISDAVASIRHLQRALRRRLLDPGTRRLALNRCDPLGQGVDFTQIDALVDTLWPDTGPVDWTITAQAA